MRPFLASAMVLALLAAAGCVKRVETITIRQDGSAVLVTQILGDPDDLAEGDAMPSAESGWRVVDQSETNDQGKVTAFRTARLDLPAGAGFPQQYAPPGSELSSRALDFPATLTVEQRADGTYYHFRRDYRARTWTSVEYFHETILNDEKLKMLADKDPGDLTDEERETLIQAFIEAESQTMAVFVDRAGERLRDDIPQDARLAARRSVLDTYGADTVIEEALPIVAGGDDTAERVEALDARLKRDALEAIKSTLAEHRVSPPLVRRFIDAYEYSRAVHEVTNDVGDEEWVVVIKMPGRIIAHNCADPALAPQEQTQECVDAGASAQGDTKARNTDAMPDQITEALKRLNNDEWDDVSAFVAPVFDDEIHAAPDQCGWTFKGQALRDRDVVLMATSFVPKP